MGTEAPSWADQWGTGGFGAMDEEEISHKNKKENDSNKKSSSSAGLGKAKAVAQKMKNGTSIGIKWVKSKCQKKNPSSS
ncbi:hypothetical protein H5410_005861 [Solanum commersonii]|uniref:Uncharacterized protein n=1 Tax=Solanum commersonii TaxID=4109 RepID=A0A9J6A8N3_SOLCO|nr:hypothetical protein H5410_005861 [Solanum commersonii]